MRDISNPVEVIEWNLSVTRTARDSLHEYYKSIAPSGEAAVVMGKLKRIDGIIRGYENAIEALTPVEGN